MKRSLAHVTGVLLALAIATATPLFRCSSCSADYGSVTSLANHVNDEHHRPITSVEREPVKRPSDARPRA